MILQLQQLKLGYPRAKALTAPLDLELPEKSILAVIGSNGSGKSTLMKTLLGIIPPYSGQFTWKPGLRFGYVPQENEIDELFPFTVRDVLEMGRLSDSLFAFRSKLSWDEAEEMLQRLDMDAHANALFRELSGGQKQRVLLGRALLSKPQVLLLDEPLKALDYGFQKKFWELLQELQKDWGSTLIIIEHDLNRVINVADWVVLLGPRETLVGRAKELLTQEALSRVYEAPLHFHEEDGLLQVHFL